MRFMKRLLIIAPVLISTFGCAGMHEARYVYQDGEYGVVGIPENTNVWPDFYRDQAEALMKAHFPEGHEIVRAEEVVEGQRTTTVKGTNTAEIAPHLPAPLLSIGKIGLTADRSQADSVKIKECRIIYRRAGSVLPPPDFAAASSPTPAQYVDPNAAERQKATADAASKDDKAKPEAKKPEAARPADTKPVGARPSHGRPYGACGRAGRPARRRSSARRPRSGELHAEGLLDVDHQRDVHHRVPPLDVVGRRRPVDGQLVVVEDLLEDLVEPGHAIGHGRLAVVRGRFLIRVDRSRVGRRRSSGGRDRRDRRADRQAEGDPVGAAEDQVDPQEQPDHPEPRPDTRPGSGRRG